VIKQLYIDNFKSLVNFSIPPGDHLLSTFTCLIGLNGSGKSTLLHAFDFLRQLVLGDIDEWLKRREWDKRELTSRFLQKFLITFKVDFEFEGLGDVQWEGVYNNIVRRCRKETIRFGGRDVLKAKEGTTLWVSLANHSKGREYALKGLAYSGSVLSLLEADELNPAVNAVKDFVSNLKALDMLSPYSMHRRAKQADDIGYGGERLSAFLHSLDKGRRARLLKAIKEFYPQIDHWETTVLRAGWKDLRVIESYRDFERSLQTPARQLSDGMLRVLAILAQTQSGSPNGEDDGSKGEVKPKYESRCLLFDEIENGINPELIQKLVAYLIESNQQIIVTTHSPMILNYLPDDIAQESVIFLYRNSKGLTRSVRFFDLPSTRKKLALLGPGEVFVDTDLVQLVQEAESCQGAPRCL
jgi:predicted ATPase